MVSTLLFMALPSAIPRLLTIDGNAESYAPSLFKGNDDDDGIAKMIIQQKTNTTLQYVGEYCIPQLKNQSKKNDRSSSVKVLTEYRIDAGEYTLSRISVNTNQKHPMFVMQMIFELSRCN